MELPKRKPNRLKEYDYSAAGAYFITICTKNRQKLFWDNAAGLPCIHLSPIGKIVRQQIQDIESHYSNVKIDKYIIMPNHIHMIISISERINPFPTASSDIPNIVGKFKAAVSRAVGKALMPSETPEIWQRSFHDHIIRNQKDYDEIWQYIDTNPAKWKNDCFYTE